MYALRPIQNCMLGKRRRDNVDVDIPEEPPAKRHHQRHLTSSPPKRQTRSSTRPATTSHNRYSLRNTRERARRTIAASPVPIPAPNPVNLRKRQRTAVDADVTEAEPKAKRHHQRHLTSPPPKRQTRSSTKSATISQNRYSLRNTRERARRAIAASNVPIPASNPVPVQIPSTKSNLRKHQRTVEDADVSEVEPKAKQHHQRHLTSRLTKRIARNPSKPAVPTQSRYSLRMTPDRIRRNIAASPSAVPVTDPIPASVSIPSLTTTPIQVSVQAPTSAAVPAPIRPSDRAAACSVTAASSSCIQDQPVPIQITRVLSPVIAPISIPTLVHPSTSIPSRSSVKSASTSPNPTHLPWFQLPVATRTRLSAQYDRLVTRTWGSHYKLFGDCWPGYFQALGLSTCQKPSGIPEVDVFDTFPDLGDAMDVAQEQCNFYDLCHHHVFSNYLDTSIDEALSQVEAWFIPKYCEVEVFRPHTLDLLRKVSAHWGFYFAYSPNKTAEEARASKLSHDLILATQELGASTDTATHSHEATSHHAALAQRCFYALYLTRIIALQRFLDCLPRDMDARLARSEWALFQYDPPRLPDGDDIFSAIYHHITRAYGPVFDLKRAAEGRFRALVKKDRHLFLKRRNYPMVIFKDSPQLPFHLAVDEVESPIYQNPSSSRRPACSRLGVSTVFYGFDEPP